MLRGEPGILFRCRLAGEKIGDGTRVHSGQPSPVAGELLGVGQDGGDDAKTDGVGHSHPVCGVPANDRLQAVAARGIDAVELDLEPASRGTHHAPDTVLRAPLPAQPSYPGGRWERRGAPILKAGANGYYRHAGRGFQITGSETGEMVAQSIVGQPHRLEGKNGDVAG